jgi:hypothetical protein
MVERTGIINSDEQDNGYAPLQGHAIPRKCRWVLSVSHMFMAQLCCDIVRIIKLSVCQGLNDPCADGAASD